MASRHLLLMKPRSSSSLCSSYSRLILRCCLRSCSLLSLPPPQPHSQEPLSIQCCRTLLERTPISPIHGSPLRNWNTTSPSLMVSRTAHSAVGEIDVGETAKFQAIRQKLEEYGIPCSNVPPGRHHRTICPACKGGETKEQSFSLYINEDGRSALWQCFRSNKCGWRGRAVLHGGLVDSNTSGPGKNDYDTVQVKPKRLFTEKMLNLEPPSDEIIQYFAERMISGETLRRNQVMQCLRNGQIVIAFTYKRDGNIVNCKYRTVDKKFFQEKDAEKIFYGLDGIKDTTDIIIVEGEFDKLSMEEAGYRNCVSVPDGAPPQVSQNQLPPEEKDQKYQYLWNCKDYLDKATRIILATDADKAGEALAEELARRLGKERCWRVRWPKKNDVDICKDANEVLTVFGKEALRDVVENAELYPIRGLFRFGDYFNDIDAYYHHDNEYDLGVSTGWSSIDGLYKVVPGELTIISGIPNSGKSEWIDALMCNINETLGWSFAVCSMENSVRDHARKLIEKRIRKPFFDAKYGKSMPRMSIEELEEGKEWLHKTFYLIRYEDDSFPSVKWVLNLAKVAVLRHGVRGLLIDPYNELDHQRKPHQTETEYVSQMLTTVKRFAQHHSCHVWFVAHPRQLHNWHGEAPDMYDISGSAHFMNKCDNGIIVHRPRDKDGLVKDGLVQICVRKVRNKVAGTIGDAFLSYNRITGEFKDPE